MIREFGQLSVLEALSPSMQAPSLERSLPRLAMAGLRDVIDGAHQWRLWYLLGSSDMRRRYARSRLGQLWIMLSSAIMISTMGLVWSFLWKQPVAEMLPFVAVSMIVWQLVSGVLIEAAAVLPANGHYFLNQYTPASTVLLSLMYRQGVTFLLNIIFPVVIAIVLGAPVSLYAVLALPGLALLLISCFWIAFVIAILCTRFRDLVQIVSSVLQVAIFVTPVLWKPELLSSGAQRLVVWNPLAVLVSVVRDPLLGRPVSANYWLVALLVALGGLMMALPFIGRYRRRLIYWL